MRRVFRSGPAAWPAVLSAIVPLLGAAWLGGCAAGGGGSLFEGAPETATISPAALTPQAGDVIGTGSVKIALILPKSAGGLSARTAEELRNAAALAMRDNSGADIQILVKDDAGTTEGGEAAAKAAIGEGARLIVGPLFGLSVKGAAGPARAAGVPIVAFSTDPSVAAKGVFLFGFLPGQDVERMVAYAAAQGKKSFAALVPDSPYGAFIEGALKQNAAGAGIRIVAVERYRSADDISAKVQAVAQIAPQIDALLVPDVAQNAALVARALSDAGVDLRRIKLIGTGQMEDSSLRGEPALAGAWYPGPDQTGLIAFRGKYRAAFGTEPGRIAPLGYEAVVLAAGLVRHVGPQAFKDETLLSRNGFLGVVSVFRFNPDGTNQRGLAVYEVTPNGPKVVSPAPTTFAAGI